MPNWRFRRASRALAAQVVDPLAGVVDFALVGRVERAQQVQQRALAGAALADDRQKLAATHAQAHAPQHGHFDRALAVALVQVDGEELVVVDVVGSLAGERVRRVGASNRRHGERVPPAKLRCGRVSRATHSAGPPRGAAGRRVGPAECWPPPQCTSAPATIQAIVCGTTIVGIL